MKFVYIIVEALEHDVEHELPLSLGGVNLEEDSVRVGVGVVAAVCAGCEGSGRGFNIEADTVRAVYSQHVAELWRLGIIYKTIKKSVGNL